MKMGELSDSRSWFKLGLTLYDGKHYEQAQEAFRLTAELEQPNLSARAFASVVWQGHINDLLGKREAALEFYNKALSMAGDHEMRHDQYGIRLNRRWVQGRLKRPFRRD
jgi:tetratricopeptide (TPR) repeat protein